MSYKILPTLRFEKELKRLNKKFASLKSEYSELINDLMNNPETGTPLGNYCYKIRFAIEMPMRTKCTKTANEIGHSI